MSRRGLRNKEQKPKSKRSVVRRLGAHRLERRRIKSCCFKRRFSARTDRIPPGLRRTAIPASRCTSNTVVFFMGSSFCGIELGGKAAGSLQGGRSITNSPRTGLRRIKAAHHRPSASGSYGSEALLAPVRKQSEPQRRNPVT